MRAAVIGVWLLLCAGGCAAIPAPAVEGQTCLTNRFQIDAAFERGAFATCRVTGRLAARLAIRPENGATNDSAWYAFRVLSKENATIRIDLDYQGGTHRYWPKTSSNGVVWTPMSAKDVRSSVDGASARLKVRAPGAAVYVAAQPLETLEGALAKVDGPLRAAGFNHRVLGSTPDGHRLHGYEMAPPDAKRLVIVLARQHPPETTGAAAFEAFLGRLLEDDEAARAFRRRHAMFVAPMVNPDGFVRGHWRGNAAGADVNRDWGPFQTSEASAISKRIMELAAEYAPVFFADFHSTKRDVIYAAPQGLAGGELVDAFLVRFGERLGSLAPEISRSHASARTTAKAWSLEALGVAGFTYETADEADLDALKAAARTAAQALIEASRDTEEPA